MRLRASTAADVEPLYGIWERSVAATHDFVSAADLADIAKLVRHQYLPKAVFTVACDEDGRVLAFMGMSGGEIDSLFVDADARGTGVGRALIEHARRMSPEGLTVEVNEQNAQAAVPAAAARMESLTGPAATDGQAEAAQISLTGRQGRRSTLRQTARSALSRCRRPSATWH